ncbi:AAA family ATPase [Pseudoduganella sp. FT25W]|uniref:AAA family ATPase n=1 Tax=Duganella alba TaxID=2666081 RepID=A0A6L5QEG9_9BURK|nr:AAA family ATPase [Duganella alba]MRX08133.1 AAA family ATPase [Duganella alba]MRX16330.1 AAA family ATPase [Duganella alba]
MVETRFTSIEVENIFAYRGRSRIDLSECTDERNVVIVSGRNGAGKTSLLNAIKLLFLSADNENIRRVLFAKAPISPKHFVVGLTGRWSGVFNTAAPKDSPAHVALEWTENGRKLRAERVFERANNVQGYTETLNVTVDGRAAEDGPALLLQLLPQEVVPFFFFDGEQIQSLADSEVGREQVEIERLLGLSFVATILREIDLYTKARYRAGLPGSVSLQITQNENKEREAVAKIEAAERARVALEVEMQDERRQHSKLDEERNRLRTGMSEAERNRMIARIRLLTGERERLAVEIASDLPPEAPWLTNMALVRDAFSALEGYMGAGTAPDVARRLRNELPIELLRRLANQNPPVSLTSDQQLQFHRDVEEALNVAGVVSQKDENPMFASLSPKQVRSLHRRFLVWTDSGESVASAHADRLRTMRQMTHEQQQAERNMDEAEITSDESRQEFNKLTEQMGEIDAKIQLIFQTIAKHQYEEEQAQKELSAAREATRRLHIQYEEVTRQNQAYQFGGKISQALEYFREQKRARIRQSVEDRLNERVGTLLAPSQLIKSVALDKQFHMTFFDERQKEVARRSISAGMRQLVAMSMLWALKDEANRPLPVIIDTPLGRIDRETRALLMSEYFPRAGNPLILLPTNSEFSTEDDLNLAGRIARRYQIQNNGGEEARIVALNIHGQPA